MIKETTTYVSSKRIPWVAMALSFLSAGVGHVYCGRIYKGLLLYFAWFVIPLAAFIAAQVRPSTEVLIGLVLFPTFAVMTIFVYAAFDAYVIAKRSGSGYELKDYNRAGIYWMLILVELSYPVALTAGVREFVYEAFYLPTRSMAPSFLAGDRVLVNKLTSRQSFPLRGDVIVFRNPEPVGGRTFIKRVIGVAGDRVIIHGDVVEINGKRIERERVPSESLERIHERIDGNVFYESLSGRRYQVMYEADTSSRGKLQTVDMVVPRRSVFVLGDHRDRSRDSRHFGVVHIGDVIGYIDYIYYPAESWSRFGVYRDGG